MMAVNGIATLAAMHCDGTSLCWGVYVCAWALMRTHMHMHVILSVDSSLCPCGPQRGTNLSRRTVH
jgi:hypothetical protein